jgi:hypothetical protein
MIIHRVPPFPLFYDKAGLEASTVYTWSLVDGDSVEVAKGTATTDNEGALRIEVPSMYDDDYVMKVSTGGYLKVADQVSVVRPYIDIKALLPSIYTEAQYAKAVANEVVARGIIDGYTNGFYMLKETYETEGSGSDYLTVPYKLNKLLKVWESGVLVYDSESETNPYDLAISPDRTSIIHLGDSDYESGKPISLMFAGSDYGSTYGRSGSFPTGKDYVVQFETGHEVIPPVVSQCLKLLVDDITCGSSYTDKYVLEYATDQYKIKYSAKALTGTGNKTVDVLLRVYRDYIVRAGLL